MIFHFLLCKWFIKEEEIDIFIKKEGGGKLTDRVVGEVKEYKLPHYYYYAGPQIKFGLIQL